MSSALAASLAAGTFGAAIGSFLNVAVHRLPRRESLVKPRSRCPACHANIAPYDNLPVLSWLLLRGRCRRCGASISARYPAIELLTAATFIAIVMARGIDSSLLLELPFAAMLLAVAGIDFEHKVVPNKIVAPMAVYGIAVEALISPGDLPELLLAGAGAFTFLLVAALAYPAGMGMGDVKLAGVMGVFLGLEVVPALFVAFLTGALAGVVIVARRGAAARKSGVPFGPFLAVGGIAALLAGPELIDAYTRTFLT